MIRAVALAATALVMLGVACGQRSTDCGECLRAVVCRQSCSGPVVQSGCCPCPSGSFDDLGCPRDGG